MKNSTVLIILAFILGLLIALIWLIKIWLFPVFVNWGTNAVSYEYEQKLGEQMVNNTVLLDPRNKIVHDSIIGPAVNEVVDRLLSSIPEKHYKYKMQIIKSDEVNAFTMPGGFIFVYTGLIAKCDNAEELFSVLAHEVGHAEKRHVVKKMVNEMGLSVIFSLLTGGDASVLINVSASALSSSFDRDQEREADAFSFKTMESAGVDPRSLATFFKKMNSLSGVSGKLLQFFATHPNDESRIEASLSYKPKAGFQKVPFRSEWNKVRSIASSTY